MVDCRKLGDVDRVRIHRPGIAKIPSAPPRIDEVDDVALPFLITDDRAFDRHTWENDLAVSHHCVSFGDIENGVDVRVKRLILLKPPHRMPQDVGHGMRIIDFMILIDEDEHPYLAAARKIVRMGFELLVGLAKRAEHAATDALCHGPANIFGIIGIIDERLHWR